MYNVYDASNDRIDYIFKNFERVYLSFSGGKDSGVMLNLVIDYMRKNDIKEKIGVMIMDNEANYKDSLEFMHKIIRENIDILDVYWCCLPIGLPCTTSSFQKDWTCWNPYEEDKWVNEMPKDEYVVNIENCPFDFFVEGMNYDVFWDGFAKWYSQGKLTANMIGVRTEESLNRWRAMHVENRNRFNDKKWTVKYSQYDNIYRCYPIYDWTVEDIWVGNAKFGWDYNKLYDMFHLAGLTIHQMRVASPFMSESKSSLAMYRAIDPNAWAKLCLRVNGANFIATYSTQMKYHDFKLPEGHTWKSFVKFLLDTLPDDVADNYRRIIIKSLKYWNKTGRGVHDETIKELEEHGIKFKKNGKTAHGKKDKERITFSKVEDHTDYLSCHNSDVLSWKRFAIMILKNDHTGKYIGLISPHDTAEKRKKLIEKYKAL